MKPEKDTAQWLRLAELDLEVARHLFETFRPMPIEPICNHCQQSAEKMLKCFLIFKEIKPPNIHDLEVLCNMCIEFVEGFNVLSKESATLSHYGVMPRYPNELELEEHDAETAIKYAEKIADYVNGLLSPATHI